jgi:hypothetical protein
VASVAFYLIATMAASMANSSAGEQMSLDFLQRLEKETISEKLEGALDPAFKILSSIDNALGRVENAPNITNLRPPIDALREKLKLRQVIIGVVGTTGTGKSSVINAILGEEDLVPTSCMRACTAVITELIYNDSEDPDKKYRAEIHFITRDDWEKELRALFADLLGGEQQSEAEPVSSEAAHDIESTIAYSKICAVYPDVSKKTLLESGTAVEDLLNHPSVSNVLGNVLHASSRDSTALLERVQIYIDSKDKTPDTETDAKAMEYWPLVKSVKIFAKSPVLETGLALVDLVCNPNAYQTQQQPLTHHTARSPGLQRRQVRGGLFLH